jgi:hypothetical protein
MCGAADDHVRSGISPLGDRFGRHGKRASATITKALPPTPAAMTTKFAARTMASTVTGHTRRTVSGAPTSTAAVIVSQAGRLKFAVRGPGGLAAGQPVTTAHTTFPLDFSGV